MDWLYFSWTVLFWQLLEINILWYEAVTVVDRWSDSRVGYFNSHLTSYSSAEQTSKSWNKEQFKVMMAFIVRTNWDTCVAGSTFDLKPKNYFIFDTTVVCSFPIRANQLLINFFVS
jgi:hypothetical protein